MCGRYVSPEEAAIEREFNLLHTEWRFPPSFNVAPTQEVPIVRIRDGRRQGVRLLRWGLIPTSRKGAAQYSTINARIETVQTARPAAAPGQGVSGVWWPRAAFTNGRHKPTARRGCRTTFI